MTDLQKKFCDYYVVCGCNGAEAVRRCGSTTNYPTVQAAKWLKIPEIRDYIDQKMATQTSALIASETEVLQFFTRVMRGEEIIVRYYLETRDDGSTVYTAKDVQPSHTERIGAAKQLKDHYEKCKNLVQDINITIVDDIPQKG